MNVTYIERSPGVWRLRIERGRDGAGKRQFAYETVRGAEEDAKRRRWEILKAFEEGAWANPDKITVAAYLTRWIENRAAMGAICRTTAETYGKHVRVHVIPQIGGVRLQRLTGAQIQAAYVAMLTGENPLAPASALNVHRILKTALTDARRARLLTINPIEEVTPPRARRGRRQNKAVEQDAVERLLREIAGDWKEDVVRFALGTGLRRGEVCGLQWNNLDLDRGRATVTHQIVQYDGDGFERKQPKSESSLRRVSLPAALVDMLRSRRARAGAEALAAGRGAIDDAYVFSQGADGAPLMPDALTAGFRRLAAKVGLPEFTFHGLRHTHITALLRNGADVTAVSARVGHSTPAMTMNVYKSVFEEDHDKLADLSGGLLKRRGS